MPFIHGVAICSYEASLCFYSGWTNVDAGLSRWTDSPHSLTAPRSTPTGREHGYHIFTDINILWKNYGGGEKK